MDKEKVKEIKKVLNTWKVVFHGITNTDLLTLINELESEKERLNKEKEKVLAYMKTDNYAKLKKEDMYWGYQMGIGMLEAEIDRQKEFVSKKGKEIKKLKDRIAELETKNEVLCVELSRYTEHCVEMKNGTLKQFAERLKKISCEMYLKEQLHRCIDETLKEFINGKV